MSAYSSDNATHSTTTSHEGEYLPCVQYGETGGSRKPTLRTIFEPVPEDAETASAVYLLTPNQYEWQRQKEEPYAVKEFGSVATKLQQQCEESGRVLYPVHIESDELPDEGPEQLLEWFREFTTDYLEIPFESCTRYLSGGRSIHVHVPRFLTTTPQLRRLKERARTFCDQTGAELDCSIYKRKPLFRLPGVEHEDTGMPKLEIDGEWDNRRMAQKVAEATPNPPASYAAVLHHVFTPTPTTIATPTGTTPEYRASIAQLLFAPENVLEFETPGGKIETPLIERQNPPAGATPREMKDWTMYNAKEFSPYALAKGGSRSVAVLKVMGTPFARREVTIGNRPDPVHALIPAYFYGARGCAGAEFTKDHEHAPLQLSKPDYEKWTQKPGDYVVIIGGNSGQSIIHGVDPTQAHALGDTLTGEDASREAALEYLQDEGYHIGKAGKTPPKWEPESAGRHRRASPPSRRKEPTEAQLLERKAEREGIQSLSHDERGQVACRRLTVGWDYAWEWFKTQYGTDFKPALTRTMFKGYINSYAHDYKHVQVPSNSR